MKIVGTKLYLDVRDAQRGVLWVLHVTGEVSRSRRDVEAEDKLHGGGFVLVAFLIAISKKKFTVWFSLHYMNLPCESVRYSHPYCRYTYERLPDATSS